MMFGIFYIIMGTIVLFVKLYLEVCVNNSYLSERLKSERVSVDVQSQGKMAELVGISREMWGKYERGSAMPGAEVFIKLEKLGFDIGYVISGKRTPSISDEEMLVLTAWRKADFLTKHKALQLLNGEETESQTQEEIRQKFEGSIQNIHGAVKNAAGRDINNYPQKKK